MAIVAMPRPGQDARATAGEAPALRRPHFRTSVIGIRATEDEGGGDDAAPRGLGASTTENEGDSAHGRGVALPHSFCRPHGRTCSRTPSFNPLMPSRSAFGVRPQQLPLWMAGAAAPAFFPRSNQTVFVSGRAGRRRLRPPHSKKRTAACPVPVVCFWRAARRRGRESPVGSAASAGQDGEPPRWGAPPPVNARAGCPGDSGRDARATFLCHGHLGHARARAGCPWHVRPVALGGEDTLPHIGYRRFYQRR